MTQSLDKNQLNVQVLPKDDIAGSLDSRGLSPGYLDRDRMRRTP